MFKQYNISKSAFSSSEGGVGRVFSDTGFLSGASTYRNWLNRHWYEGMDILH